MTIEIIDDYSDLTDAELKNRLWELEEDIQGITEQIDGVYQLQIGLGTPETKDWLFRAFSARRYRRAELRQIQNELAARNQPKRQQARDRHVGMLVNARFVKAARQRLASDVFDTLMRQARDEASRKLDENAAPVQAA